MPDLKLTLFFTVVAASAVLAFVLGVTIATLLAGRRQRSQKGDTQVGFVLSTFQDLVAQLKDKERELDSLRAMAEKRAGEAEGYNEDILQSVPSGVISLDEQWRVVKANSAARRILALPRGEPEGKDLREMFGPDVVDTGAERGETQFVTPQGKDLWLGYMLSPLKNSEGQSIGRLFVFTDLTELRAFHAQAELRQRLSSLGEMSAGIAHELKNSMGVISGYMRMLAASAGPELKETVGQVTAEVGVMDRIINDFLSFARPTKLSLSDVALRGLVLDSVSAALGGREDVEVTVSIPPDLMVRADEVLLKQVLLNLLSNASDAMAEGGRLVVTAAAKGGKVSITVVDTGHGVDDSIKDKVFMPFYTTKDKGTGLGLAIVHRIVTEHSGTVRLGPGSDGGTIISLTLPIAGD